MFFFLSSLYEYMYYYDSLLVSLRRRHTLIDMIWLVQGLSDLPFKYSLHYLLEDTTLDTLRLLLDL